MQHALDGAISQLSSMSDDPTERVSGSIRWANFEKPAASSRLEATPSTIRLYIFIAQNLRQSTFVRLINKTVNFMPANTLFPVVRSRFSLPKTAFLQIALNSESRANI